VLDRDAGDLVDADIKIEEANPNICVSTGDSDPRFGVAVNIDDMAEAIGEPKRCVYATDDEDRCERPAITDNLAARTFVRDGITVIEEDVIIADGPGGMLVANVAAAQNGWVGVHVFFDGESIPEARTVLDALVDQVIAHSKV
jgi:hypothetical protein